MVPTGSEVDGVVVAVASADYGVPAMIELSILGIRVNGRDQPIAATTDPVIAGSVRAHELGAIAGEPPTHHRNGAALGGIQTAAVQAVFGGDAIAGVREPTRAREVVLRDGTVVSFTTAQTVAMR